MLQHPCPWGHEKVQFSRPTAGSKPLLLLQSGSCLPRQAHRLPASSLTSAGSWITSYTTGDGQQGPAWSVPHHSTWLWMAFRAPSCLLPIRRPSLSPLPTLMGPMAIPRTLLSGLRLLCQLFVSSSPLASPCSPVLGPHGPAGVDTWRW